MTSGLIVNPHARRRNARGLALAERLKGSPGVKVAVLEQVSDLPAILHGFAKHGVDTMFVSAGDGTVHALLTELAERSPFARLPRLGLLAHGTTNMTASDIGLRGRSLARQAAVISDPGAAGGPETLKVRPTVKVVNASDGRVRYGMFLATGAIWRGTRFCREKIHATGLKGDWAAGITLAAGLARAAFGRAKADEDRLDRPYQMRIEADGKMQVDSLQVTFFVTTLDRFFLRMRPFWGGGAGGLRATAIGHPPPSLLWTPRVLYGGQTRKLPAQCRSFTADSIMVSVRCPFVMDGEAFDPPEDQPLRIETGPKFTYLCGS
jgi:diacylglycerol kinase (ATP)